MYPDRITQLAPLCEGERHQDQLNNDPCQDRCVEGKAGGCDRGGRTLDDVPSLGTFEIATAAYGLGRAHWQCGQAQ